MNADAFSEYMSQALREAELAFEKGEVPVGAVVVHEGRIIGRGHNLTESLHDATAHAEMIALSAAFQHFNDWRLESCYLFSTIEPCAMCAGAAVLSRIQTLIYGATDPKFGGCQSIFSIPTEPKLNHNIEVISGVREEEAAVLMQEFFRRLRNNKEQIH